MNNKVEAVPDETSPGGTYATPALEKGLDILELLAHERDGLTKSEIARALQRTVSEIFRMLVTLEKRLYISAVDGDRYVLSLRLFQLVQEHPPTERLLAEALPSMHRLSEECDQSCHLGVLDSGRVVILAQTNAPSSVGFYVKTGAALDLLESTTGQAILAHLPKEAAARVLEEWRKVTGGTPPPDLGHQLERIRRRGYEKRGSFQVRGVVNISSPIVDGQGRAVGGLTVPFLQRIGNSMPQAAVEKALARTTQEISARLGATTSSAVVAP